MQQYIYEKPKLFKNHVLKILIDFSKLTIKIWKIPNDEVSLIVLKTDNQFSLVKK